MAHKKKHSDPVPAGNQPHAGPNFVPPHADEVGQPQSDTSPEQFQDPKRRQGDFTPGEHSFQQPGGQNDANH
jgi:hypothetical protein